ncbi:ABC transporter permease [Candidatus Woesearchaeota archaeon]|nr:ABC transporter permease [Candidatus Woesearchaeota archaeon]
MIRSYLNFSITSIRHRKFRSILTVIGIMIGIAAVVTLVMISAGLQNYIVLEFEQMGTDLLMVMPKGQISAQGMEGLTIKDEDTIKSMAEVNWAMAILIKNGYVEYSNEKQFAQYLLGLDTENFDHLLEMLDITPASGRSFQGGEKYSVVMGPVFAKDAFDKEISVNTNIYIKGQKFRVIGILEPVGNQQDDSQIYLPIEAIREIFDEPTEVSMVYAKLNKGMDAKTVADKMERRMKRARDDELFMILTPDQLLDQFNQILSILEFVLGGIAAISLLVGGIGIMNSMYTSVLERTKEVGIMKAIGASNKDIMMMFVFEAGLMGVIGGVIGVTFGIIFAFMVQFAAKYSGYDLLKVFVDWELVAFILLFAFAVGSFAGYLPAKRAAKMKPVEALAQGK